MEEMSEELIIRFFKGQCNPEEAQAVGRFLDENKEAAEKYTGKREWDDLNLSDFFLSKERSQQMLEEISFRTYRRPIAGIPSYRWAIAASIMLIVAAGVILFNTSLNNVNKVVAVPKNNVWRSEKNVSNISRDFVLADGTSVELAPASTISYQVPFPEDKREIRLSGQGLFKVARDKKKPFTVFSGNLATTALGTQFTITAFPDKKSVSVKLHEGKVLVKQLNADEVFYLLPAQELMYNEATGSVDINSFSVESETTLDNTTELQPRQTGVSISFDREPLKNVFDQLERAYRINLTYPKDAFRDNYFTGSFNKTDSLERVLRIIAQTNELEIIKTTSSYKIIKKR